MEGGFIEMFFILRFFPPLPMGGYLSEFLSVIDDLTVDQGPWFFSFFLVSQTGRDF